VAVGQPIAVPVPAGSVLAGGAAASPPRAADKPPAPVRLLSWRSLTAAALADGGCGLARRSAAGAANGDIQPLAVATPAAGAPQL
jgi:hypothetical protein